MTNMLSNAVNRQKKDILQPFKSDIKRSQLAALCTSIDSATLVKVITGPRRCGKSTLARQAIQDRKFAYVNFEDDGIPENVNGDEILSAVEGVYGSPDIYFFDEIQNMRRWEQFIHRLHREGKNCVITGSNAHLLSSELASALTGRHRSFELLPFSYEEFLSANFENTTENFLRYIKEGGFPEVVLKYSDAQTYLSTLWDSIILKDVVRRHKVRNISSLNNLYNVMLHAVSSRFNHDSLVRSLDHQVSAPTIKNFLRYGREAYLVAELEQFHFGARKRIKSDRKGFTYDNGFVTAKRVQTSLDLGRLLENLVFIELLRRGYKPNIDLFYYVSSQGHEVDFV
jgi:predicted AAA+ superfamily ATPase